jgi:hypothetical protein
MGVLAGRLDRREPRGPPPVLGRFARRLPELGRVDIALSLLDIAAAVLAVIVVLRITARQLERESRIEAVSMVPITVAAAAP